MEICRDFIQLRYRLMPYIYASAVKCVKESLPMMRPLIIEYQNDPNVAAIDSQWLFGDDLLVAPICDDSDKRQVYLPAGIWTDWWNGEKLQGSRWITAEADITKIPLFIREGAEIPMGPDIQFIAGNDIETTEYRKG
jgi:alpha-glucosidase (family GH31 glycosyl hydrolase)